MRIKVKTLKTLVFAGILAIGGIFAGGMISKKVSSRATYGESEKEYCCGDIIFGNSYVDPGQISAYSSPSSKEERASFMKVSDSSSLGISDFDIKFTDSYYKKTTDNLFYPARVGKSKGVGNITITLKNNMLCDKVLVYAAGYTGHNNPKLSVNNSDFQSIRTSSGSSFDFKDSVESADPYVFTFEGNSTITFKNAEAKQCVLISKIVFRMYTVA